MRTKSAHQRNRAPQYVAGRSGKNGLEPLVFLHYPPVHAGACCEEILSVLKQRNVKRCFYGHIHGDAAKRAVNGIYDGIDFKLVPATAWIYTVFNPVNIIIQ